MAYNPYQDFAMNDHVAIVTGGARNIGEAIATIFAGAGAKVMIADLDGERAALTAKKIAQLTGNPVRSMTCDVAKDSDVKACVAETVKDFGGISTLVNNVGWGELTLDPLAVPTEKMLKAYELNTISALRMVQACAPWLQKAKNASITNSGKCA